MRRRTLIQAAGAATATLGLPALAQTGWPSAPVRIIVGFPPGGGTDALARILVALGRLATDIPEVAELEEKLDRISNNEISWQQVLKDFWTGFIGAVNDIKDLRVSEVLDNSVDERSINSR